MSEIVLLAVTKMLSGVCIGGVPPDGGAWVRPVKSFGSILPGDIRYADGNWMAPFDLVELNLQRHRPAPPHVEDWSCDFIRPRPRRVRRLEEGERRAFLEAALDPATEAAWEARRNSLALIRPAAVTAHFSLDGYSGRYEARMEWPGCPPPPAGRAGHPVTDLRWRALGRRLLPAAGGDVALSGDHLQEAIGGDPAYLAVGLSRSFEGQIWPLVVGVHCLPDYQASIDPANL